MRRRYDDVMTMCDEAFLSKKGEALTDADIEWGERRIQELKDQCAPSILYGTASDLARSISDHINMARSQRAIVARENAKARAHNTQEWEKHLLAIGAAMDYLENAGAPDLFPVSRTAMPDDLTAVDEGRLGFYDSQLYNAGLNLDTIRDRNAKLRRGATLLKGKAKERATAFIDALDADLEDAVAHNAECRNRIAAERERRAEEQRKQQDMSPAALLARIERLENQQQSAGGKE